MDAGDGRRAVAPPARRDFALGGRELPRRRRQRAHDRDIPFNVFSRTISQARVNLCITRRSHASVYA